MKKRNIIIIILSVIIVCLLVGLIVLIVKDKKDETASLNDLPKPEVTGGSRGELGIDKNINETNIDKYLNRKDAVYRDMRMLEDPANYEAIGGDRYLSGYIKGFEVVPLPYIVNVTLPGIVGETYKGDTLFTNKDGQYIANYEESMGLLERYFPKDKIIFLMCGGGGYAGMTKNLLVSLGWNPDKIYNVGGYWYYRGNNNIEVKKTENGKDTYAFDKVPYHEIKFSRLTPKLNNNKKNVAVTEVIMNSSTVTIEEGYTARVNVIVLPNEATNKNVRWTSSNKVVATISEDGLITAQSPGTATITATTESGSKTATCKVTVTPEEKVETVILDDITSYVTRFKKLDPDAIYDAFYDIVYDRGADGSWNIKPEYVNSDGLFNDKYMDLSKQTNEKIEQAETERENILNELVDAKKSFILLIESSSCEGRTFSPVISATRQLEENNIPFIRTFDQQSDYSYYHSKLKIEGIYGGQIVIVKNGKIIAYTDENKQSFNDDDTVKKWLLKYINM